MDQPQTPQQTAIEMALAQAKRVQRESRLLVQALARLRDGDYPQPQQEAQEQDEQDR